MRMSLVLFVTAASSCGSSNNSNIRRKPKLTMRKKECKSTAHDEHSPNTMKTIIADDMPQKQAFNPGNKNAVDN
uniref:Putative secreted protein n=1 Tax=Anopheles marajoara TaxID=58244 RepID=A0A2M4CEJ2_9DIPT